MSQYLSTAYIQQYTTVMGMLVQQEVSRLRPAVGEYSFRGMAADFIEQFGAVNAVTNPTRHSDTPIVDVSQDRRWMYPTDFHLGVLTSRFDLLRTLIDPNNMYTRAIAASIGRGIDDMIISGYFSSNNTGQTGQNATGLLSAYNSGSQVVGPTVGASGNTGLNVAKLKKAKEILLSAEVEVDTDPLYCIITAKQHTDLLNEVQVTSLDYNTRPVLVDGMIKSFMGFNFIHSERIPGAANFNTTLSSTVTGYTTGTTWLVPAFAKSGMALGVWNDIVGRVDELPQKNYDWQVYGKGTFGASRVEEKRCTIITCY